MDIESKLLMCKCQNKTYLAGSYAYEEIYFLIIENVTNKILNDKWKTRYQFLISYFIFPIFDSIH